MESAAARETVEEAGVRGRLEVRECNTSHGLVLSKVRQLMSKSSHASITQQQLSAVEQFCAAYPAGPHARKVQVHGEARQAAHGTCEVHHSHVCDARGRRATSLARDGAAATLLGEHAHSLRHTPRIIEARVCVNLMSCLPPA